MTEKEFKQIAEGYFTHDELNSPDIPCSGLYISSIAFKKLVKARKISGVPYIINSGVRSPAHNKKVNGSVGSSHLINGKKKPCAFDISCTNNTDRFFILSGLIKAGFKRILVYKNFIHADTDKTKDNNIIKLMEF
jgi:hypothetical protein